MPTAPLTYCITPGCTSRVVRGYCSNHQPIRSTTYDDTTRKNTPALKEAARIRSSAKWQRLRRYLKAKHPICCDPLARHPFTTEPTVDIHHIQGLADAPSLAFEAANLAPVCRPCHNMIEALSARGIDTTTHFIDKHCVLT